MPISMTWRLLSTIGPNMGLCVGPGARGGDGDGDGDSRPHPTAFPAIEPIYISRSGLPTGHGW